MGSVLDDSELDLFDLIASDFIEAGADECNYYSQDKSKSVIDPLYGEYVDRHIDGPWNLPARPMWPNQQPMSVESGFTVKFEGKVQIARFHFEEQSAPYPSEGDIIEMWRTPFHDVDSLGKGLFFDVVKVDTDGHINDTSSFTHFELTLTRRPQFGAERKITPP